MAILRRNCPHCPAEHVAFEVKWDSPRGTAFNAAAVCGACKGPIVFWARRKNGQTTSTGPAKETHNIEPTWQVIEVWPSRSDSAAPPHTPPLVAKRFLEGEDAYRRQSWNAAVAMYRSALDIATKAMDGVPTGKTFYKRLEWLHDNHRITPEMRSWADHVRVDGNDALHEPEEFTEEDAKPLRLFTDTFLRYVFELPGEVEAFRLAAEPEPFEPVGGSGVGS
ncbi:DUF4145 domain-containing protein [Brevundimonas sp.]|uniref:DUF4145 domain-containing protein n=1 Tax=Brevundimonas sp. TaxID=1871086 RepID=UPI002ABAB319|nr:DUF4145 domain-containing protein [Brevundimonas sp.]MDZ4365087.1 DUF4145 domain-containing protein [Brevundimonas sp.]